MEEYIKIARAHDLKDPKDRALYRFFEILPGLTSWLILILTFILSFSFPFFLGIFFIFFSIFWFLRTLYYSFLMLSSYRKMRNNEAIDWKDKIKNFSETKKIFQLVILPMYQEPYEVVKESFKALISTDWPKEKMIIVLSCEEEGNKEAAIKIIKEFQNNFPRLFLVFHPKNLEQEIKGKGANDSWASKKAKEIIDYLKIPYKNIIVSSFDVDTIPFKKYFSCLTYYYLTSKNPLRSSFQPIPLFINNILETPFISRIFAFSTTFWEMLYQEKPEKFSTLVDVGFRQANVVSDDSRIFWQCFIKYNGNYKVVPIFYPVSMDANCGKNFFTTLKNIYLQQRRWAYGTENIPYVFFNFIKNKKIPLLKKIGFTSSLFFTHITWTVVPILLFVSGWLPVIVGGSAFNQTLFAHNLPYLMSWILTISMTGIVFSVYLSIVLLPHLPFFPKKFLFFIEWIFLPISLIFFSSLPSLEAQTRLMFGKYLGFWSTPKARKK